MEVIVQTQPENVEEISVKAFIFPIQSIMSLISGVFSSLSLDRKSVKVIIIF